MKKERMANLELLRCVAMMMVVVLHYLGKSGLLPELAGGTLDATGYAAWLLESFCIVAVNVYMFISGYFLSTSSFKLSRLLQLWLQVWFYSVAVGGIAAAAGVVRGVTVDTHYFLTLLFPVGMRHYWFMTAYVFLYLFMPLVGFAVQNMTKEQLRLTMVSLLLVFCVSKSVMPVRLEMDGQGYDCIWYLCVFVAAAYMRRFGFSFLKKKGSGILLYAAGCLLIFGMTMALRQIWLRTGSLERMLTTAMAYNHVLTFAAAVGLFVAFCKISVGGRAAAVINRIAPYTLGVYLLHENIGLRYTWQQWLRADRVDGIWSLLWHTAAAVLAVFVCGVAVDMLRAFAAAALKRVLLHIPVCRGLADRIQAADALFAKDRAGGRQK